MIGGLLQPMHLLVILVIALLVFGPGKLEHLGRDLGKSITEFRKAIAEKDVQQTATAEPQAKAEAAPKADTQA